MDMLAKILIVNSYPQRIGSRNLAFAYWGIGGGEIGVEALDYWIVFRRRFGGVILPLC